ncbi:nuclear factor of activated T-cells, cytoplasmic 1-like, partial [Osmerus eperlanus]|uniref:nuclear factor of activated T-cells, cytoplasmic 1-like n=1 Tax=Osmerus eperlanus TaxID=29151 RepID=UPI002E0E4BC7
LVHSLCVCVCVQTSLVVEIPPYRNQRISSPVQVNFYVCNGKRKRSQYQRFTYLSPNVPIIKTEPSDEYEPLGVPGGPGGPYYGQPRLTPIMPVVDADACLAGGYPPCPPRHGSMASSASSSPTLHDLSPVAYPPHGAGPLGSALQEAPGHPSLSHCSPPSPDPTSSPLGMLHSQGSPHLGSPSGPHGYHSLYPNSSPSSSPASQPSTPGGAAESPFIPTYSPHSQPQGQAQPPGRPQGEAQARGSPPSLQAEASSSPPLTVTVKQEPQELDQMYLDDGESLFHAVTHLSEPVELSLELSTLVLVVSCVCVCVCVCSLLLTSPRAPQN